MKVLVTGGAGYVGSLLVPALLARGHDVAVMDWYLYGQTLQPHPHLTEIKCDLRGLRWEGDGLVRRSLMMKSGQYDAVIHLACISNDPSFELDPELGKSVNYDATVMLVQTAKNAGVSRFIYASSSSVYGVKPDGVEVTEDLPLEPLTDYSKYKAMGEEVVLKANSPSFTTTVLRPATLCGYAPRLRLDLIVHLLTKEAFYRNEIPVLGGAQLRPNLHIQDMVRAYLTVLDAPAEKVAGEVFNVGAENISVLQIARMVHEIIGGELVVTPTDDRRSYQINSQKIHQRLGFFPERLIEDAVCDLRNAFKAGKVPNALTDPRYYNIQQMKLCHIS